MTIQWWDKWLALLDEDVAYVCVMIMILMTPVALVTHNSYIKIVFGLFLGYIVLAAIRQEWYRYQSRRFGLKYFILIPNTLIPKLFAQKLHLGEGNQVCWKLHINRRFLKKVNSGRKALRYRREDIKRILEQEWPENVLMVGSTFTELGKLHTDPGNRELLSSVYDFPLYPFYPWMMTKNQLINDQKRILGKVYMPLKDIRWKTFIFIIK